MPLLALPILAALCLASCTDEKGADRAAEAARTITFAANVSRLGDGNADTDVAGTRSTIEGSFAEGDLIGVGIEGVIKPYRYAADGRFVPDEADNGHYWQGNSQEEEAEIIAYYPYNNGELQCLQPADQSSPEKLAAADILTARAKIKRGQTGPITFAHQPARIVINLRAGRNVDDATLKTAVLTLQQAKLQKITIDPADGSITPEGAPAKDGIILCELATPTKGYCRTAEALCSSQTYAAGTELLRIVVAGKTYPYYLPADKTLSQNTRYTYNVTVNDADITVTTTADDIPWENTEALPPGYDLTIANEEQLRDFAEAVNSGGTINGKSALKAIVLQTADIELTKEWTPIGKNESGYAFEGKYNGNGHIIENMTITETQPDEDYHTVGMFGYTVNAVLTGINLRNVTIDVNISNVAKRLHVGSIAALTGKTIISHCSATGRVSLNGSSVQIIAGGIVGLLNNGGNVTCCRAKVEIMVANSKIDGTIHAGGINGSNSGECFILSCEAQSKTITAEGGRLAEIGGIVGHNNALIAFCHARESIIEAQKSTKINAGGLVGFGRDGCLYSCYFRGSIAITNADNNDYAGILVGYNEADNLIEHCYGTGTATPDNPFNLPTGPSIIYGPNPAPGEIFELMQSYADVVESKIYAPLNLTYYPYTTRYDSSSTPAYGIDPIRVKWTSAAWKMGIDPIYPEIDMLYQGIDNNP